MKKILTLAFVMTVLFTTNALADDAKKSMDFVKHLVEEGIDDVINSNDSAEVKREKFRKIFNEGLDLDFIGKFVLGRYWKTASETQRDSFLKAYSELNIQTWSARFDDFKGKTFSFQDVTDSTSKGQYFVNSTVDMGKDVQPAKVVWRVKKTGNELRVVDIIIENVSLAITARNEYTAYIKANNLDALIKDLEARSKAPVASAAK